MNEVKLNIFTWCDENYADFIPLFVVSNLYYVKDCVVEVCLDTDNQSIINKTTSLLNEIYPNKFLIRNVKALDGFGKAAIRFVIEPQIVTKYVYISDIDIVTLQSNLIEYHLGLMQENNLPYSNVIQGDPRNKRLSGLHFTPYENYYPISEYDYNSKIVSDDRRLLYHLVEKRFPNIHENKNTIRPVHGIHMSPNRDPHAEKVGWALKAGWKRNGWIDLVSSKEFNIVYPHLSDRLKNSIDIVNKTYKTWRD